MIRGFHKEGRTFLLLSSLLSIVLVVLIWKFIPLVWLQGLLILTVVVFLYLFFQFFRVPHRKSILDPDRLISPCDGKVVVIEEVEETEFLKERCWQISIFMSPLNVHINWYPAAGEVVYSHYHPGAYLVAWHPKSSTENERTTVAVRGERGTYLMRQIAGAVARRIICYAQVGDRAAQNQEMGFIKFGSRVDVFIPLDAQVEVAIGDKVKGNRTPLASWS
ncbi:MAG: phosphatidylserine decarboxylase family protein [Flavobacteriales bacterium]|nr:phosphatidylserine decarboxylase family protein [Flavobacteriales bacterium]